MKLSDLTLILFHQCRSITTLWTTKSVTLRGLVLMTWLVFYYFYDYDYFKVENREMQGYLTKELMVTLAALGKPRHKMKVQSMCSVFKTQTNYNIAQETWNDKLFSARVIFFSIFCMNSWSLVWYSHIDRQVKSDWNSSISNFQHKIWWYQILQISIHLFIQNDIGSIVRIGCGIWTLSWWSARQL